MGKTSIRLLAAALIMCWSAAALAQGPRPRLFDRCDVTFDPVVLSQPYNPMAPNDYVVSFTTVARRLGSDGGEEARGMNYSAILLKHANYRLPTQLFVLDSAGGSSGEVLYDRPGPPVGDDFGDNGEIEARFEIGQAANPGTYAIRIPAGTEIDPGQFRVEFDVKYVCNHDDDRTTRGTTNHGFTITFPVTTALQASLVGTEPDFGEIGTLSDIDVAAAGPSVNQRRHYLRVASSGPYEVMVASQNNWRMTATGAPSGNAAERIAYRYELLDQQLDSSRPNFTPVICEASGISGENISLTAVLTEGGLGRVPSPVYRDIVTVTVTPLAVSIGGAVRCD
jgi:hypothetical protein